MDAHARLPSISTRYITLGALLLCSLLVLLLARTLPAHAQEPEIDIEVFYEELAPHGRWLEHDRWGYVWSPDVPRGWRPYSRGYWVRTEEHGWYWHSEEPWGWAVFHYGRWTWDEDEGWLWIPGTEWGPAWVVWRWGEEHVGWAPLGPGDLWGPDGVLVYDEVYYGDPRYAHAWCFVRPHFMLQPVYRFLVPAPRNFIVLRETRWVSRHRRVDRRVFNVGIDVHRFESRVGRPLHITRLRSVDKPRDHGRRLHSGDNGIAVYKPRILQKAGQPPPRPRHVVAPGRKLDSPTVKRGFGNPDQAPRRLEKESGTASPATQGPRAIKAPEDGGGAAPSYKRIKPAPPSDEPRASIKGPRPEVGKPSGPPPAALKPRPPPPPPAAYKAPASKPPAEFRPPPPKTSAPAAKTHPKKDKDKGTAQ